MPPMKQEEIAHLARLARIKLTNEELHRFEGELSSIVSYVSTISEIVADTADGVPQVGIRHNIFRKDEVTNEASQYTDDLLHEMPHTDGRYMKVKKILQTE